MGYYTWFTIKIDMEDSNTSYGDIVAELEKMDLSDFEELGDCTFGAYDKWYYHHEDMVHLSAKFPGVLFTLTGDGEDSDDKWREFFYNGKSHCGSAQIIYPEFDKKKLKENPIYPNYTYQYAKG